LIHHRPETGLQAKFSIEYAVACALLDDYQGFDSFTDAAAVRPDVRRLVDLVEVELRPGGGSLLDGRLDVEIHVRGGTVRRATLTDPLGSPRNPASAEQLAFKIRDCLAAAGLDGLEPRDWAWPNAAEVLRTHVH
jgi:2-methylcitrate dehydratase PrpD